MNSDEPNKYHHPDKPSKDHRPHGPSLDDGRKP